MLIYGVLKLSVATSLRRDARDIAPCHSHRQKTLLLLDPPGIPAGTSLGTVDFVDIGQYRETLFVMTASLRLSRGKRTRAWHKKKGAVMKRWIGIVLVMLTLAGCGGASEPRESTEYWDPGSQPNSTVSRLITLTDDQAEYVHQGVRNALKDPDSAIFGRIIAGALDDSHASLTVCGWVNAKNSFGGYTGGKPFIGTVEGVFIETAFTLSDIGDTDTEALAVLIVCDHYGLSLDSY